mmetsp:Transcript_41674/g.48610  ORF Transcript_41674/g.48610 Transcript_41674/m.48610 type:complete len:266 (+) Transcript_41674:3009-3806(+)
MHGCGEGIFTMPCLDIITIDSAILTALAVLKELSFRSRCCSWHSGMPKALAIRSAPSDPILFPPRLRSEREHQNRLVRVDPMLILSLEFSSSCISAAMLIRTSASATAPSVPMLLNSKCRRANAEASLEVRACARFSAPFFPIRFQPISRLDKSEFTSSASHRSRTPLAPNLFPVRFKFFSRVIGTPARFLAEHANKSEIRRAPLIPMSLWLRSRVCSEHGSFLRRRASTMRPAPHNPMLLSVRCSSSRVLLLPSASAMNPAPSP